MPRGPKDTLKSQRSVAGAALFAYGFLTRFGQRPQQWQMRMAMALVNGELTINQAPEDADLRQVHEIAGEVSSALDRLDQPPEPEKQAITGNAQKPN